MAKSVCIRGLEWLSGWAASSDTDSVMLFAKGNQRQSCDVQEASLWYELIITGPSGVARVERYTERAAIMRRQEELLTEWKAHGWRELEAEPAAVRRR
jgi:hypothetical protein